MFKNINNSNKAKSNILKTLINTDDVYTYINNLSENDAIALYECIRDDDQKLIDGITYFCDGDGGFHFEVVPKFFVNDKGLKFIRKMKPHIRLWNGIVKFLKSVYGTILTIIATVLAQWLILHYF